MSYMGITPLGTRVLVERQRIVDQKTEAGILVPAQTDVPTYKNVVRARGVDVSDIVMVGDVVLTTPHVGDRVLDLQAELFLMEERDLLAVIVEVVDGGSA